MGYILERVRFGRINTPPQTDRIATLKSVRRCCDMVEKMTYFVRTTGWRSPPFHSDVKLWCWCGGGGTGQFFNAMYRIRRNG